MTYSYTTPHNYQTVPPPTVDGMEIGARCSPNLLQIRPWLIQTYGGMDLGCYQERSVRGGTLPSTHFYGAAFDWRYTNVGGGRIEVGRDKASEIVNWMVTNALALGIQQIHDYLGSRIWKIGRGWRQQPASSTGMGQAWAQYIHVEVHPTAWWDARPVTDRQLVTVPPVSPYDPEQPPVIINPPLVIDPPKEPPMSTTPTVFRSVTVDSVAVLREGHQGSEVKKLQALLTHVAGQDIGTIDGVFGPRTTTGVRNVQTWFKITVDGICGPQTWRALFDA